MGINAQTSVPKFTIGDVLTAANTNLLTNAPPVFAGTATRDAAFGGAGEKTLAEGQLCYLEDQNIVQFYDGAAWQLLPSGMSLVQAETSFTTAATFSANNVFTSTYKNYRIILNCTNGAGSITLKLRASATDTSANYNGISIYGTNSNPYQSAFNALGTDELYICDMEAATDGSGVGIIDVLSPQAAFATTTQGNFYGSNAGAQFWYSHFGRQSDATQFDGFTFLITSTGMTGTYTVYGYNK